MVGTQTRRHPSLGALRHQGRSRARGSEIPSRQQTHHRAPTRWLGREMDHGQSSVADFERSVFINCPFDKDYFPLLKAMLWLLVNVELKPRLSLERSNAGEGRLRKIRELIEASKYGIHDLSRLQAKEVGELYRLNMPFELGIDYACRLYSPTAGHREKVLLVLEGEKYSAFKALSDINFTDPKAHVNDPETLVAKVRDWLVDNGHPIQLSASGLWLGFTNFYFEFQLSKQAINWSHEEIEGISIKEFLDHVYEVKETAGATLSDDV